MFIAASTHCFAEASFSEACHQISELEYDKVELWFSEATEHWKPSSVAHNPERFHTQYRETTRLTPVAIALEEDVDVPTLKGLSQLAKLLRVTQITIPPSPLGTPFNTEIDRLRAFLEITSPDGVCLSLKTKTGHLTEDPRTAVELCQSVRGLGLTLDPSYYIWGTHREPNYEIVFPYVYHVHLRDTTRETFQVPIGLGEVDYSRLVNQLRRHNYQRALSVDLVPTMIDEADRPLEMRKLRMLLDTLL